MMNVEEAKEPVEVVRKPGFYWALINHDKVVILWIKGKAWYPGSSWPLDDDEYTWISTEPLPLPGK